MKSKRIKYIPLITSLELGVLSILPAFSTVNVNASNKYFKEINNEDDNISLDDAIFDTTIFSQDVNLCIYKSYSSLSNYRQTKNLSDLDNAIIYFTEINLKKSEEDKPIMVDDSSYGFSILNDLFLELKDEIYRIDNYSVKSARMVFMADKIFISWRKSKVGAMPYFIYDLKINNDIPEIQEWLDYLDWLRMSYTDFDGPGDINSDIIPPKEDFDDNDNNNGNEEVPELPPVIEDSEDNKPIVDNNNNDNPPIIPNAYSSSEYVKKGNDCYNVTTLYNSDGSIYSSSSNILSKTEYIYCGIYDYIGVGNITNTVVDNDYIENNQNEESKNVIYYTVNKDSDKPYYYNTGIKTNASDDSITYNQLRDALYLLSVKAKGYSIDSNEKSLIILEGKPIVLDKKDENYSKLRAETLLKNFKSVGIKIMEDNVQSVSIYDNSLLSSEITSIVVDGEDIILESPAIIKDSNIVLPLEVIASSLGADVSINNNSISIKKGTVNIIIKANTNTYIVNGKNNKFNMDIYIRNNSYMGPIEEISGLLGYKILWDSDEKKLIFTNS